MEASTARITARVDSSTQALLSKASAIMGLKSINAFVVSAAVEKANQIVQNEISMKLSQRDAELFVEALDNPKANERLRKAYKNYEARALQFGCGQKAPETRPW